MNGYILISRKIVESGIFQKPPLYLKVWMYLLCNAQFKDYGGLKRGELITSIAELQEACSYRSGYRRETPSTKQIRTIIEWLRSPHGGNYGRTTEGTTEGTTADAMIVTTKVKDGILVSICNFNDYQDPKFYGGNNGGNYGGTAEGTTDGQRRELRTDEKGHNYIKNTRKNKEKHENYIDISNEISSGDDVPDEPREAIPYVKIQELYNHICKSFPRCVKMSSNRKNLINGRWHGDGYRLPDFERLFRKAEASKFLRTGGPGWKVDIEWLIRPSNMTKVLEGKYDNRDGPHGESEKFTGKAKDTGDDDPPWIIQG